MNAIIYTLTDEAPALATCSLLPIIKTFCAKADVEVDTRDISLAGRILAAMSPWLPADQKVSDALAQLGALTGDASANIIKLPNISASMPQLLKAIAELQDKGFSVPNYPDNPCDATQQAIKDAYDKVKGSAVNPVLRQGNSDRRAPDSVKHFARLHPHSMGAWLADSKTNVATMSDGDFAHNELSIVVDQPTNIEIDFIDESGRETVLKSLALTAGEVFDASFISALKLDAFLVECLSQAKQLGVLFSVHLKATMMKVSDPIIFGHVVKAYFADVFAKYGEQLSQAGANPNHGLAQVLEAVASLSPKLQTEINQAIADVLANGPDLAMVNSAKGVTNLHVPSDVIVDASMPAMIRSSGKMWNKDGQLQDSLAVIPDSSYAGVYQSVIDDCRVNGAYDPASMGSVSNVGLMASAAEEYGSHDKTFEIKAAGEVVVKDSDGNILIRQQVQAGDIWRGCQTKDASVRDWVKLAVHRGRATGSPVVFWLDDGRAHDRNLIAKVTEYLRLLDTENVEILIMDPTQATKFSVERIRRGENTISATGNVLRDYLTDLFPILELGTSAKMLSIVPLLAGGGLFETGAGGSAPKHVEQLIAENHLRWDSLGEFLALAASLEKYSQANNNPKALILAKCLDRATETLLNNDKSAKRDAGQLDNRGSHFWLAKYWAAEIAKQSDDLDLAKKFSYLAEELSNHADQIDQELLDVQSQPADLGGYYLFDHVKLEQVMRPSLTFNQILASA